MFEAGSLVWVEFESNSAIIGYLTDVGEDELELVQTHTYYKSFVPDYDRLRGNVEALGEDGLRETLKTGNLLDLLAVRLGYEAMVNRMLKHVAKSIINEGIDTLEVLPVREKLVVPRHGAVVRDGQVALYRITGYPKNPEAGADEEAEMEAEEARIEQAVNDFSEQVEKYNKGDLF